MHLTVFKILLVGLFSSLNDIVYVRNTTDDYKVHSLRMVSLNEMMPGGDMTNILCRDDRQDIISACITIDNDGAWSNRLAQITMKDANIRAANKVVWRELDRMQVIHPLRGDTH